MNDLCADIGYKSINHAGEELCGDHVDVVEENENSTVIVLADGLGSGVKASILSTLTSKIISTMMAAGLPIEECVSTIAATLPICSVRGVAYSTFTIIHLLNNQIAEIIQYDNPHVIVIRDYEQYDYPKTEMNIGGKKIYKSTIRLKEDDVFIAMSDGCPHAGMGGKYNFGWKREDIADYMQALVAGGYTAKNLSTMLVDECDKLYGHKPGDDTTACVVKIRKREPMNILFGPPSNRDDANRMMSLFFSKEGKHIICGGTTSSIAAKYLGKKVEVSLSFVRSDIPPIAKIEGVDLVTEGVITMNKVIQYLNSIRINNPKHAVFLERIEYKWNEMNVGEKIAFKAALEAENPQTLRDCMNLMFDMDKYEFCYFAPTPEAFAKEYLLKYLPDNFDRKLLETANLCALGNALMDRTCARATGYGLISTKGGSIFNIEFTPADLMHDTFEYDVIEVCDKKGLFLTQRIKTEEVPEGHYKYDEEQRKPHLFRIPRG